MNELAFKDTIAKQYIETYDLAGDISPVLAAGVLRKQFQPDNYNFRRVIIIYILYEVIKNNLERLSMTAYANSNYCDD